MIAEHWSDQDNDAIVALYFQMLTDELAGRDYNKATYNRSLQEALGRSKGSIEFKNCNISAAVVGFGLSYARGYQLDSIFRCLWLKRSRAGWIVSQWVV